MKTKLTLLMIIACLWLYSSAQWQQLYPRPINWAATGICSPGENKVFAVSASSILISENLGATWNTVVVHDFDTYFNEISFANPNQGVASSSTGRVYVTSDGGQSWVKKQLTPSADLNAVKILPSGIGFAGGYYGQLYKTTDFGENWTKVQETFDQDNIEEIFLLDDNNVYLFDDWDAFYWSNNGGQTWNASEFSNLNKAQSMHFFDANNGLLGDDFGTLLKTTNGGQSWQTVIDDNETDFFSMSFLNADKGIVGCWDKLMITADGGQNWQEIDMPGYGDFRTVEWKTESIIFAGCEGGIIIRSVDGGLSWEKIIQGGLTSSGYSTAAYFDDNTILAFTLNSSEILRSKDGGFSWSLLPSPAQGFHQYRNSCAINGEVLYVITTVGKIFKTTNGGNSWQVIQTGISVQSGNIYFLTPEIGFFTAMDGTISRTTNGGENWSMVSSGTPNISKIAFYDNELGLAVGANGTILRTTNGGLNWTAITNANTEIYNDVYFVSQNLVFAVGKTGRVYRSQDAGLKWERITTNVSNELFSMVFITPDTGYITTSVFGTNLKTTDGGEKWSYDPCLAPNYSRAIKTPNGSILMFGGYGHISILPAKGTWNTPATPVARVASAVSNVSFTANWEPAQGAKAYLMFVSDDNFQTHLTGYFPKQTEETTATVEGLEAGKIYYYRVMAANEAGNSDYSNTINVQSVATGITSIIESKVRIYPNPANNRITITKNGRIAEEIMVSIFSISGNQIMLERFQNQNQVVMDVSKLTKGIYLLKIQTETGIETKKLVIR